MGIGIQVYGNGNEMLDWGLVGMEMITWEWEGMGTVRFILAHLYCWLATREVASSDIFITL